MKQIFPKLLILNNLDMKNMADAKNEENGEEDLGNYITQVVTDIGSVSISKDIVKEFSKVSISSYKTGGMDQRCKMASVSNPEGVSCEEYSQFAFHAIKYLSYLKSLDTPDLQELIDSDKMVDFEPYEKESKSNNFSKSSFMR